MDDVSDLPLVIPRWCWFRVITWRIYWSSTVLIESAICSFFLIMTLYPEIRRRAQDELDGVSATARLTCLTYSTFGPWSETFHDGIQSLPLVWLTPLSFFAWYIERVGNTFSHRQRGQFLLRTSHPEGSSILLNLCPPFSIQADTS